MMENSLLIHYCWFGRKSKPDLVLKCIESWRRYCPNARIIEWNEDNFDINICQYVKQAYDLQKWAFVSDYCRYYVLYKLGGIYLDTDVELIKDITDLPETFIGFEFGNKVVASGLIRGAQKGDEFCRRMLVQYEKEHFQEADGSLNLKTVCERETKLMLQAGLKLEDKIQKIGETTVYPTEYFCPYNHLTNKLTITTNTYSVHYYMGSWLSQKHREMLILTKKLSRFLPVYIANNLSILFKTLQYDGVVTTIKKVIFHLRS